MSGFIKPLQIGAKQFAHNLIQGPLAGYSCAPFRKLFYQFAPPAYCVTEMISAQDLVHRTKLKSRYIWRDPAEQQLCYQLSGNCANILRQAAAIVADLGADLIDLNCGCPKPKIRKKQCGSYLLNQPEHIAKLVSAMKSAVNIPITVKMRVDGDSNDGYHLSVATAAAMAGADALIVHGRHWTDDYTKPCRLDQISAIAASVNIPVIGNGDVHDVYSVKQMLDTGCSGVMISRAGSGKPWIFQKLMTEISSQAYSEPPLQNIVNLFCQHITELAQLESEQKALLESRKLMNYYFRDYFSPAQLKKLHSFTHIKEFENGLLFN